MRPQPVRTLADIQSRSIPEPNTGCWLWLNGVNNKGYGMVAFEGRSRLAHRVAFALANGIPLPPPSECVLHRCDTPLCVNPDHHFRGSKLDNVRDMIAKGRRASVPGFRDPAHPYMVAQRARRLSPTCKRGHEFTPENTGRQRTGSRYCRKCHRMGPKS